MLGYWNPAFQEKGGYLYGLRDDAPGLQNTYVFIKKSLPRGEVPQYITPLQFFPDHDGKCLVGYRNGINLYPIPFSAASGIKWQGQSVTTGLASLSDLKSTLAQIEKDLVGSRAWSFSTDKWTGSWDVNSYYGDALVPKQYLGLVEEKE